MNFNTLYFKSNPGENKYLQVTVLVEKYYETLDAPYKEFIWFENSAHFPQYTESDKFNNLLLNISNKNMKNN